MIFSQKKSFPNLSWLAAKDVVEIEDFSLLILSGFIFSIILDPKIFEKDDFCNRNHQKMQKKTF